MYTRDYSNVSKTRFYVCIGYVVTIEDSCRLRVQTVLRCMYNRKQTASLLTRIASRAINGRAYSLNVRTSGLFNKYTLRIFVKNIFRYLFRYFFHRYLISILLFFFTFIFFISFVIINESSMNLNNSIIIFFFYRILTHLFRTFIHKNLNNAIFNNFFKLFIHPCHKIYILHKFYSYLISKF